MSLEKARAYAAEHLASVNYGDGQTANGLWVPDLREKYGVKVHGGVNLANRKTSDIWFEVDPEGARQLVDDSQKYADVWDLSRSICINNLLRERPIPRPLREFVVAVLLSELQRPRASETYNNSKRDLLLSSIIFEVWALYNLSETKACEVVKDGATDSGLATPASLIDIWRKSEVKRRGLPVRTEGLRKAIQIEAADRLATFKKLQS